MTSSEERIKYATLSKAGNKIHFMNSLGSSLNINTLINCTIEVLPKKFTEMSVCLLCMDLDFDTCLI